jgi:uncharacterized protein YjbJ (UPF0337 family)
MRRHIILALHVIFQGFQTTEVKEVMDKDRVKGKLDDAAGRAKRQVGEWTGDTKVLAEGAVQQVKGKVENAWGKVKDAARDAADGARSEHKRRQDIARDQIETDEDRNVA